MFTTLKQYIALTKPTIMLLVLFTGSTALIVEGSLLLQPLRFALVLVGLYFTGGAANALNQYFERDLDAQMKRTAGRRPLPMGTISPGRALVFSIVLAVGGVAIFALYFNWLTAGLATATLLFYSLYYTLYLKPTTAQNIVIGGIAGAMAPVGAWTAATGSMALIPWVLFAIVFFWTPPHFWTLAIWCKDDYSRVGLPMLPVVRGDKYTYDQIMRYSLVVVATSLTLVPLGFGWIYIIAATLLGWKLVAKVHYVRRHQSETALKSLFGYSLAYLFGLFLAVVVDDLLNWRL
ncbi:MAG: heme o synthase [Candidatus Zixiibacteriota bacterium]